ncbi:MAG: DNA-binding protein WhiA [Clostridia bacterium]|nr:DNA-binding protein WhiA [Clostridia bacterium]
MSFSSQTKEDLSKINNLNKKDQVQRELIGYLISSNTVKIRKKIKFSTENEYNINRFGKLLKNCDIEDYKIEIKGKIFTIEFKIEKEFEEIYLDSDKIFFKNLKNDENLDKALIRGLFLGSGYINNPEKKYHLEINLSEEENLNTIHDLLIKYNIHTKKMQKENSYSLYIKDGEEISKLLAFIGANWSVLKFEENRVIRDTKNNVNRLINCETANFTKTIKAGSKQIEDIKFIKSKKKFGELPENLKIVANIRLEHPEASLTELVVLLGNTLSKSGVSHRLSAISKFADELRGNC